MMKFTEEKLENVIIELLGEQSYPHVLGDTLQREPQEVLNRENIQTFLMQQYQADGITYAQVQYLIQQIRPIAWLWFL